MFACMRVLTTYRVLVRDRKRQLAVRVRSFARYSTLRLAPGPRARIYRHRRCNNRRDGRYNERRRDGPRRGGDRPAKKRRHNKGGPFGSYYGVLLVAFCCCTVLTKRNITRVTYERRGSTRQLTDDGAAVGARQ